MKIHGSFINRLGDTVAVEITTRTGGAADMEIGTEEAGLWFDADAPVAIRAEANLYGVINGGNWMFKAYTYNSERGIPGAIVNNVWRRGERQWDHNTFFQGSLRKEFSERFSSRLTAKYAYYDTHYVNNDTTTMLIDNYYKQQEVYVSLANVYEILKGWSASVSYDFKWNKLNSDLRNFVFPRRYSHYVSVATAYDGKVVKVQGSLLGTFVKDNATNQAGRSAVSMVTPAAFVSVYPFSSPAFALRAFAKKSFRMPTFNELYYTEVATRRSSPRRPYSTTLALCSQQTRGRRGLAA